MGDQFSRTPDMEPDFDTAAEAWLSLESIRLGMDFAHEARKLAIEFEKRLTKELNESTSN